jgi:hypothetical protein
LESSSSPWRWCRTKVHGIRMDHGLENFRLLQSTWRAGVWSLPKSASRRIWWDSCGCGLIVPLVCNSDRKWLLP